MSDAFFSEVTLLSKLDHPHVVRYFAAWKEEEWTQVRECDHLFDPDRTFYSDDSEDEMPLGSPCYSITVYMQMALYEHDNLMNRIENESRQVDPGCNLSVLKQILEGLILSLTLILTLSLTLTLLGKVCDMCTTRVSSTGTSNRPTSSSTRMVPHFPNPNFSYSDPNSVPHRRNDQNRRLRSLSGRYDALCLWSQPQ